MPNYLEKYKKYKAKYLALKGGVVSATALCPGGKCTKTSYFAQENNRGSKSFSLVSRLGTGAIGQFGNFKDLEKLLDENRVLTCKKGHIIHFCKTLTSFSSSKFTRQYCCHHPDPAKRKYSGIDAPENCNQDPDEKFNNYTIKTLPLKFLDFKSGNQLINLSRLVGLNMPNITEDYNLEATNSNNTESDDQTQQSYEQQQNYQPLDDIDRKAEVIYQTLQTFKMNNPGVPFAGKGNLEKSWSEQTSFVPCNYRTDWEGYNCNPLLDVAILDGTKENAIGWLRNVT